MLNVWLIQIGEPIPIKKGIRKQRLSLLCEALVNNGHQVIRWGNAFDHITKKMIFEFIYKNTKIFKIEDLANVLNVSRSGYYRYIKKIISKQKLETIELDDQVTSMVEDESLNIDNEISLQTIYNCIEQLPQKCKNVVTLYLLEGYDHQEVAQILQITEIASRSQLSRGKNRLRELLIHNNYES